MHFSVDDYEGGDKSNRLKPNACPMISLNSVSKYNKYVINNYQKCSSICICVQIIEGTKSSTDSEYDEFSSTSDVNSDDLPDTPNTSDLNDTDDLYLNTSVSSDVSVRLFYL